MVPYGTVPDVLLAQFRDNRREMSCKTVSNEHLDVILGELLDVAEENLTRNNFLKRYSYRYLVHESAWVGMVPASTGAVLVLYLHQQFPPFCVKIFN
jgi:hypothetical protein